MSTSREDSHRVSLGAHSAAATLGRSAAAAIGGRSLATTIGRSAATTIGRSAATTIGRSAATTIGRSAATTIGRTATISAAVGVRDLSHIVSAITRLGVSAVVRLPRGTERMDSVVANLGKRYEMVSAVLTLRGDRTVR